MEVQEVDRWQWVQRQCRGGVVQCSQSVCSAGAAPFLACHSTATPCCSIWLPPCPAPLQIKLPLPKAPGAPLSHQPPYDFLAELEALAQPAPMRGPLPATIT